MNTKSKITPYIETHPGEVLQDELKARKKSQLSFASEIGVAPTMLNEIIKGKRSITADLALLLEKTLDISAKYWLNLQSNYELDKAILKQKNIKKSENLEIWNIIKQYIPVSAFKKLKTLTGSPEQDITIVRSIYNFTHIEELINLVATKTRAYYKKSDKLKISDINLLGWTKLAVYQLSKSSGNSFEPQRQLELLDRLKIIFKNNVDTVESIKACLADFGIKFNVITRFEQTPVDGFSCWSGENPGITLTLRSKKIDNLAFTVFHELGHIFLHLVKNKNQEYIDFEHNNTISIEEEEEANQFAVNSLVPLDLWNNFLRENFKMTDSAMIDFATDCGVHPSIILGRYCFETQNYAIKTSIDRAIR